MNTLKRIFNRNKLLSLFKSIAIYMLLFLLISALVDYWRGRSIPKVSIPNAVYQSVNGDVLDVQGISQDGVTLLYFWATWCGPCKLTSPSINSMAKHVPVVSIAMASGDDQTLQQYAEDNSWRFSVVNDHDQTISSAWSVSATPTILMLKDGKVVGHTSGVSTYPGLYIRTLFARLW